ncbi:MAG: O-antigen ligase family protein [Bacteroidales bacterium]|nr:O-antigen ligase family protein [Bacteroidales bacterium]
MINQRNIIRLYQAELIIFAFLLPIYRKVIPYAIAMIIITWFFDGDLTAKIKRVMNSSHRTNLLLFAGIYILYLIGLSYSDNFGTGLFNLEVKLSLFIFPVMFASIRKEVLSLKISRRVLTSFVFGVFASMLLCYSVAFFEYAQNGNVETFYYSSLSVLIHPSYLAMYVCFAIAVLLYYNLKAYIRGRLNIILSMILVLLFQLFVVMLSSKAGILGLILVIALFSAYTIFSEKRLLTGLFSGFVLSVSFLILFFLFPASSARFEQTREVLEQAEVGGAEVANSTGERIMIWYYTFEITNENFLFGVGTGDVIDHLLSKYNEKGMRNAFDLQLNAHNQYLQTFLALGIVGLIVLLLTLLLPAIFSVEQRHYLYLMFLVLISFNFLFESMLETQAGVVFYAFFNAYFFSIKKDPVSPETGS